MTTRTISLGTVLVVGGCGFLGSHVVDQLLNFPSEDDLPSNTHSEPIGHSKPLSSSLSTAPPPDPATWTFPSLRERYPSCVKTSVHVLDLRCNRNRLPGAIYHEGDITDPSSLLTVFRTVRPDVVINSASGMYDAPKQILQKVNIDGTKCLVEVAGGVHGDWGGKCKAFVHTSSASVIHDSVSDLIFADERWPYVAPNPVEYYSETKVYAERIVLEANRKHGSMLTCAIRPAGIVGENDRGGITFGLLTTAALAPSWQLHIQIGQGSNLFDTTYVGNVVHAHLLAAKYLLATHALISAGQAAPLDHERVDGEAFNVTNDEPAYFWDTSRYAWACYGRVVDTSQVWTMGKDLSYVVGALAELSNKITGRKAKLNRQTVKYACMTRTYSCEKAKQRLGYRPLVSMEEGWKRGVSSFVWNERADEEKGVQAKKVQ
jgi:sterol-4alpha-carboxylate 3-dehydrogenase (decarboxylating)